MQATQRRFIEQRFGAKDWYGRGPRGRRMVKEFGFEGSELVEWRLERSHRDEGTKPPSIHSIWRHDEAGNELLAVDAFECASVKAAHDQLIEILGDLESPLVERRTGKNQIGDVSFVLNDTMVLFARANIVLLIRNAGRSVVKVGVTARVFDKALERRIESERKR
ncbi:MAG TPA: hypothetical protein VKB88_42740 [Bryobacteraceae bacterium]|nr:hypothetical protein [Bryobacteraceae bacterium]